MKILVGHTGFVGQNLFNGGEFSAGYSSKNIAEAYGLAPDMLVFSGLRAEKFLANANPEQDRQKIEEAKQNIVKINPKKVVLISTIDVFKNPACVDENSKIQTEGLEPYGYNRYAFEEWVRENYHGSLVVRLPALFGEGIKKNFIYDIINVIPSMLKPQLYESLNSRGNLLEEYYELKDNNFYKCIADIKSRPKLKEIFAKLNFSAANFTDSRSAYQFYNLARLWGDIKTALNAGLTTFHPATEPVTAAQIYKYCTGNDFINENAATPAKYDYRTAYCNIFGGKDGYISESEQVLEELRGFINNYGAKNEAFCI